jgi:hypothetical protein
MLSDNHSKGAFVISRSLFESDLWMKPPEYSKLWLYIIGMANHEPKTYRGYSISRGQHFCTYDDLSEQLVYYIGYRPNKPNESTTKRILKYFRDTGRITTTKELRGVLITVINYDKYQSLSNYERTNESTIGETDKKPKTNGTHPSNNKNVKNDKNEKKASEKKLNAEQFPSLEEQFKKAVLQHQWADEVYVEKTWDQRQQLSAKYRAEFDRKVTLMVTWARSTKCEKKARPIFHEIAGFVNDHGAMKRVLSGQEQQRREGMEADE